ncbi:DUF924 family protein [Sneathiella glossodoripedis]|uniref:DUF924 family protein n=1 Tax=Sneathiella glossodoripedis TaxID=418853 RepID=UPI00046FE1B7|nr:DUF924 family protein [Sneathiella glossodoripedis]
MTDHAAILDFWFFPKSHPDYGTNRDEWFQKNDDFDAEIKSRFLEIYEKARAGELLSWTEHKEGSLALIILLDQFPRNMFRASKKAFETDGKAREITRHMLDRGFFDQLKDFEKTFAALPLEHSENLQDQQQSLMLFKQFGTELQIEYAQKHLDIIEKFGRFPHRNAALGRESTPEEIEFLKTPGSSF